MPDLKKLVAGLKRHYGEPDLPPAQGPFELVLWENACYLLPDERRAAVFVGLREQVGNYIHNRRSRDRKDLDVLRAAPGLPLESNGLRVLTRVGFGRVQKSYGAKYGSVQEAIHDQLPRGASMVARAHLLLRQHRKTLCRSNAPLCRSCPVSHLCLFPTK